MTELPLIDPANSPDPLAHSQNYRLLREKFNGGIGSTDISAGGVSNDNLAGPIPATKLDGAYARGGANITNTTSETNIFSKTIAAGDAVNRMLFVRYTGAYLNNSGAGRTITLRIKFGATTLWGDVSASIAATGASFRAFTGGFGLDIKAGGQLLAGQIVIGDATLASVTGSGTDGSAAAAVWNLFNTSVEDATTAKTFAFTAQHSAASSNLTLAVNWVIELI